MAGYSGTPLAKKLGIKGGSQIFLLNAPGNYLQLVSPLPEGVPIAPQITSHTDVIHIFSTKKEELSQALHTCLEKMRPNGMIWVSWPKKSSKVPTDITEDTIREVALPLGLVDTKVCAVDDVWSGLKLVIRKEKRK
jgi:Protein of unknown function (DUF3052)